MTATSEASVTPVGRSSASVPRWSPPEEPQQGADVAGLMRELQERSRALDRASNELYRLTLEFEGGTHESVDVETGQLLRRWEPGPQLRWDIAVSEAVEEIAEEYEKDDKKVPAAERLRKKGELRAKLKNEELWADFHHLETQMKAMQKWISARRDTLSSRQSVLSAEKALVNG